MSEERCETCWFWLSDEERDEKNPRPFGTCHRNPPTLALGLFDKEYQIELTSVDDPGASVEHTKGIWPSTEWHDWCGEWQPKRGST